MEAKKQKHERKTAAVRWENGKESLKVGQTDIWRYADTKTTVRDLKM